MLRRAVSTDAAELTRIAWEAKRHWGYAAAEMEGWRHELTITAAQVILQPTWIWQAPDRICGFASLSREDDRWNLAHLWVLPADMRHGIGGRLLTAAMAWLKVEGATEMSIDSDPQAEPFYRKAGAIRVGSVAAPLADDPERRRPLLILTIF